MGFRSLHFFCISFAFFCMMQKKWKKKCKHCSDQIWNFLNQKIIFFRTNLNFVGSDICVDIRSGSHEVCSILSQPSSRDPRRLRYLLMAFSTLYVFCNFFVTVLQYYKRVTQSYERIAKTAHSRSGFSISKIARFCAMRSGLIWSLVEFSLNSPAFPTFLRRYTAFRGLYL